jgi:cytoplasmic iron level regulating protein YaaA (DUF328/UPF0246 family)
MHIVISPSKALDFNATNSNLPSTGIIFHREAQEIMASLKKLDAKKLGELMKISDSLAGLNFERNQKWQFPWDTNQTRQAIMAFHGDVYEGIDAASLTDEDLLYAQDHLSILSGLYGVLRPLDDIMPYRLEMGTKLAVGKSTNLYRFWDGKITSEINARINNSQSDVLVNLASDEYFKSVKSSNLKSRIVTPEFKDEKNGTFKVISFYAKRARGLMTRYIISNRITNPEDLAGFAAEGYYFEPQMSSSNNPVFIRLQKK